MARTNFVEDFIAMTANMASPEILRRWSAISMVSTAMSRRIWTCIEGDLKLFPNTFIMLVSAPGLGKSRPMDVARKLLVPLVQPDGKPAVVFCPDEITRQRVIQHMGESFTESSQEGARTYLALISEFATFMPEPDASWLQALARIWDCPPYYGKETKTSGSDALMWPYLNILAGVHPDWFAVGFPRSSYEMGFPARTFFIYDDVKPERAFFQKTRSVVKSEVLGATLQQIQRMEGEVIWTPDAKALWNSWASGGFDPAPTDPMLRHYATRRDMHGGKLALIAAAATHPDDLVITSDDLNTALEWLFEAEARMPIALAGAGGGAFYAKEEAILSYIDAEHERTGKAVNERDVRRRLGQMVSVTLIAPIINELLNQRRLKAMGQAPHRLLRPGKG